MTPLTTGDRSGLEAGNSIPGLWVTEDNVFKISTGINNEANLITFYPYDLGKKNYAFHVLVR